MTLKTNKYLVDYSALLTNRSDISDTISTSSGEASE